MKSVLWKDIAESTELELPPIPKPIIADGPGARRVKRKLKELGLDVVPHPGVPDEEWQRYADWMEADLSPPPPKEVRTCPLCGAPMAKRDGKYGAFWGCEGYPDCKHTESIKE